MKFLICTVKKPKLYLCRLHGTVYSTWVFDKQYAQVFGGDLENWVAAIQVGTPLELTFEEVNE